MSMKLLCMIAATSLGLFLYSQDVGAQSNTPKIEVGAQFSAIRIIEPGISTRTEPGFGGRLTYNVTRNIGLEAELGFFPKRSERITNLSGGRTIQGLFGAKVGIRREKVGVFGKLRPGFLSFSGALPDIFIPPQFGRVTHFALDAGGVVEFYPTRRSIIRFDLGDTVIHYGKQTFSRSSGNTILTIRTFNHNTHNVQFSAGIGIRF